VYDEIPARNSTDVLIQKVWEEGEENKDGHPHAQI
jgi:hypothetical protein